MPIPTRLRRFVAPAALLILVPGAVYLWRTQPPSAPSLDDLPLSQLEALVKQRPDDPETLRAFGRRLLVGGSPAAAVPVLQRAAKLAPNSAAASIALADALADAGDLAAARTGLEAFLAAHPNDADAHFALGRLARRGRRWPVAYEQAQQATRLNPKLALAWHLLGQASGQLGKLDEARAAFVKAYEIDPKHWEIQLGRGEVEFQQERYAEAAPFFREAMRLGPNEALPALSLGQTLLKASKDPSPEARAALTHAAELRPEIPLVHLNLGRCLLRDGDLTRALDRIELARDLAPDLAEIQQELGRLYLRLGRAEDSTRAFTRSRLLLNISQENRVTIDRVASIGPDTTDGRRLRTEMARRLASAGLYDNAFVLYKELIGARREPGLRAEVAAMEARRDREDPPLARGDRLVRVRQFDKAAAAYQRALTLDPKSARTWEGCGVALAALGETDAALPCLLRAVRLDPKRLTARTALGEACYAAGFPAAAVRWLKPAADAQDPGALHLLGLAQAALADPAAVATLESAAQRAPERSDFKRDADAARARSLQPVGAAIGSADAKAQEAIRDPDTHATLARTALKGKLDLRAFVEFTLAQMLGVTDPAVNTERLALGNRLAQAGDLPAQKLVDALAVASMPEGYQP